MGLVIRRLFFTTLLISLWLRPPPSRASPAEDGAKAMSAYDALRANGLPIGLLPKGVREFQVDAAGRFEVGLEAPCTAHFETEVRYDRNVSGALSYGQILSLSGISAQELFLWFPVNAIRVLDPNSGLIFFDVGGIRKQFSLSLFETPPECTPLSPESESFTLYKDLNRSDVERTAI